ncbi:carboxypeptidase-like regulatory domain-containing protein [Rufibacter sediminis]|uniref:Carboxypeptidase-like regulatory domain-containing protein n=1 Tax=Rufibacter sediminis TaxID=2762756 RepID=A0ABR6VR71_9BACT|nr:carboxypeptidase-like regulatory domain-containing protein [Rufibacter sediminis]MBC3539650.1 carboxypeptidase-like regulatory domain-containing protein [Rufibacter sediminis]
MSTRRLTISVPQPCHEDWQAMAPTFQGRFCQNCQKTVVDFTAVSDSEIVDWLTENKDTTCGRFRHEQVGTELKAATYNRKPWTWRAVALVLSAWLSTKNVEAKQVSTFIISSAGQQTGSENSRRETKKLSEKPVSPVILKGKVVDARSKETLPGTTIMLKGTSIGVPSDRNGNFELSVPAHLVNKKQKIIFSFIGYEMKEVKLSKLLKREHSEIIMTLDTAVLGGIAIQFNKPLPEPGFFQKVKQLFS